MTEAAQGARPLQQRRGGAARGTQPHVGGGSRRPAHVAWKAQRLIHELRRRGATPPRRIQEDDRWRGHGNDGGASASKMAWTWLGSTMALYGLVVGLGYFLNRFTQICICAICVNAHFRKCFNAAKKLLDRLRCFYCSSVEGCEKE